MMPFIPASKIDPKSGLRRRDKFEDIIGYTTGEKKGITIKPPNRKWTNLRNSLEMTNLLDGMFDMDEVKKHQIRQAKRDEVAELVGKSVNKDLRVEMAIQTEPKPLVSKSSGTQAGVDTRDAQSEARATMVNSGSQSDRNRATQARQARATVEQATMVSRGSQSEINRTEKSTQYAPEMFDMGANDKMDLHFAALEEGIQAHEERLKEKNDKFLKSLSDSLAGHPVVKEAHQAALGKQQAMAVGMDTSSSPLTGESFKEGSSSKREADTGGRAGKKTKASSSSAAAAARAESSGLPAPPQQASSSSSAGLPAPPSKKTTSEAPEKDAPPSKKAASSSPAGPTPEPPQHTTTEY